MTTSKKTASALEWQLRAAGVHVAEIGLRGRFHSDYYQSDFERLLEFCETQPGFQFPDASGLVLPTWANSGHLITHGKLHHVALRTILTEQLDWYRTFAAVQSARLGNKESSVISFGPERCIPPSLIPGLGARILYLDELQATANNITGLRASSVDSAPSMNKIHHGSDNDIAVVGMSCNVAGAEDLEQFWKILVQGKSQHQEVPGDRFGFETAFREADPAKKWYGNFISNHDAFDHKFFKKTPREVASMDPQQRILLQTAYQALEQSGYFEPTRADADRNIGCYMGVCATDYEYNVSCHAPNAFSATGNLRSFIAGKVSHYFGWTGPGLTIDTACSASAVAIHQACQAILNGECSAALAGGTNMMTQPLWFQNLAAASFLSPTGQCKPFDVKADGYCRGEGIAVVFLKKMSAAIADGDQIFGTISSTAVYQNQNCTPIFVPNAPSLSDLFRGVLHKAGLEANQVSVVEAHGTGTPVGDPAEYDSIRQVFGGIPRPRPLQFGSVKGLIGHTEGTSGVASLVKVLLMINEGYIPPQASFSTMNPAIKALPADNMEIPTTLKPWDDDFRAALINNYGASGSNASIVVTQAPRLGPQFHPKPNSGATQGEQLKYPFWFSGFDDRSLRAYSEKFRHFLNSQTISAKSLTIENLSFNVARQSNRSLGHCLILSSPSIQDLAEKLQAFESGDVTVPSKAQQPSRPVILCFGGQISTYVGLSRGLFDSVEILRRYLDQCDSICLSLGAGSIYPGIFEREPIADPTKLQGMLFALQYSCAKSWIDCGIRPAAVVGHSFGELTALCISGVLSLRDALKMVIGRAKIIRDSWGHDKGSMMAVEGDLVEVEALLAESNKTCEGSPASIACFNGPRSFTLAGPSRSIDAVSDILSTSPAYSSIRAKKLNVTNAFHSSLVEPIMAELEQVGRDLQFKEPNIIPLERAAEAKTVEQPTGSFVSEHMRNPVYFNHAVQRLAKEYPSSIWLEAGSNSTITTMASRALGLPRDSHFQHVNITGSNAMQQLIDTTVSLWKAGSRVTFWGHSTVQTYHYAPLVLPPYQFDKTRHWIEFKKPPKAAAADAITSAQARPQAEDPKTLWTFTGYQDNKQQHPRFRINTTIDKYLSIVSGHVIAQTAPICPATLQVDMAIEALLSLHPSLAAPAMLPQIRNVSNQAPVCVDPSRQVWLDFEPLDEADRTWRWKITSSGGAGAGSATTHVTGELAFRPAADAAYLLEFGRLDRLFNHRRCVDVLDSPDADEIIQGRSIYRVFASVVDYSEQFFGLQKLVGKGNESAGRVVRRHSGEGWLDPFLGDCFSQVGGIWVNCMTDKDPGDMYIANGFEQWTRSPRFYGGEDSGGSRRPEVWHVLAHHDRVASGFITDIFVFDPASGALAEVILGISYAKVAKLSMSKLLARLSAPGVARSTVQGGTGSLPGSAPAQWAESNSAPPMTSQQSTVPGETPARREKPSSGRSEVSGKLKAVLADISGLEPHEIKDDVELADIGIDSLMGMEMAREVEETFKCTLSTDDLMQVTDYRGLLRCLQNALGISTDGSPASEEGDLDDDDGDTSDAKGSSDSQGDYTTPFSTNTTSFATSPVGSSVNLCVPGKAPDIRDGTGTGDLNLPPSAILEAFGESKKLTDQFIEDYRCAGYLASINPKQTQLCVALTVEAFQQLGCDLASASAGQELERIQHVPEQGKLAEYLYRMLEETRIIDMDGDEPRITRTAIPIGPTASDAILQDLVRNYPDHAFANQLAYWTGSRLADVLTGKADGLKLIFGSEKGRELVSGLYGDSLLNKLSYKQMSDFLTRLISKMPQTGPLKILEMGAGTGGTTKWLVPMLASLGVPVEYTFTDLSGSFVAAARKKFKEYSRFMNFRVHDIEKPPADELLHSQHLVIASNAVHATHSLSESTTNIRKMLRPDGALLMLEMTETIHWVDVIFGVLEGWWLFDDGRTHAIAHESRWERELHAAGYGHVDWTDGCHPETNIQKIFIALASGERRERLPAAEPKAVQDQAEQLEARREATDEYVRGSIAGFLAPTTPAGRPNPPTTTCVMVTGATGSLGAHLVAHLARQADVGSIICLNRRSPTDPVLRQRQALEQRGISLDDHALSKLKVVEADTAKPQLGLGQDQYHADLVGSVTHIVHNAWPMSGKRPLRGFESQFRAMRHLLDLARDISCRRQASKVSFLFVSSIATVGHHPLWTGSADVPEDRVDIRSVLPNGYGDAKFVCERMLDETLGRYPLHFRAASVRLGQVAGSGTSGYWNEAEHFSFLVKSSQTLRALPDLGGLLSWTPVDSVAATLADLVGVDDDDAPQYPVYHVDNPVRQPWPEMIAVLADELGIPATRVVPFAEWIRRVRAFPGAVEWDNPAAKLVDFLDDDFVRMSCGGVLLDTARSREHSPSLRGVGPVSAGVARKYIQAWRDTGFLRR